MIFLELSGWQKAIRGLGALICDVIYMLISKIYELFITVARLNILSSDQIAPIYQRVTMILTIVMTFYITFEFVKYTIQPDNFTDNEKGVGNIMKRIIIVVALIAFTPTIFKTAYELQNRIIETQLISKMILGTTSTNYTTYGNDFSANMLGLFYYYDEEACADGGGECDEAKTTVEENLNHIRQTGDSDIVTGINLSSTKSIFKEKYPAIKFNGILAIIVGAFILYILAMYSIDVGVRYAQLIFLQIMSPIAIMGYIIPKKDGIFQKWGKQCITTYLDLFIRIIIINFVLLLVKVLGDAFESGDIFAGIGDVSGSLKVFTYIVLVMGLLLFAQRAPKLLGELLPGGGGIGFGLSGKERFDGMKKSLGGLWGGIKTPYTAGKAAYSAGARVVGGVGGAIAGTAVGTGLRGKLRAAAAGAKEGSNKDNKGLPHRRIERAQEAARQRVFKEDEIARGVPASIDREEAIREATYHKERWANIAAEQDRKSKLFDTPSTSMDNINKNIDEFKQIKALKQELESAKSRGASAAEVKTLDAQYKAAVQAYRGVVAKSIDADGNFSKERFTELINQGVTFDRKELDANGFVVTEKPVYERDAATGEIRVKIDPNTNKPVMQKVSPVLVALRIDDGDLNFVGSVSRTIDNEFTKMGAAAREVVGRTADGKDITIGDTMVKIKVDGADVEKTVTEWLADPNGKAIFAENVNKFKDAMVDEKNKFENTVEYAEAHAYKDGIGDSGGKK